MRAIFSGSGAELLNLNSPIQVNTSSEVKILVAGYYQIHINFRFSNNGGAQRASIQNFLVINGVYAKERIASHHSVASVSSSASASKRLDTNTLDMRLLSKTAAAVSSARGFVVIVLP